MTGTLIGIVGNAVAGKDTIARVLVESFDFEQIGLADPMKDFCQELFGWSDDQLWGPSQLREQPDQRYVRADGNLLTPRYALQQLGTQWGRDCCPTIWLDYAMRRANEMRDCDRSVVVADVRFLNEIARVKAEGGRLIRVLRPGHGSAHTHSSELEQQGLPDSLFDETIVNCGTLEGLRDKVLEIGKGWGL